MPVYSRSYNTTPGSWIVFHPSLFGVRILGVKREGIAYTSVALGTQVNMEFSSLSARIFFDPTIPFAAGERVWVIYEN